MTGVWYSCWVFLPRCRTIPIPGRWLARGPRRWFVKRRLMRATQRGNGIFATNDYRTILSPGCGVPIPLFSFASDFRHRGHVIFSGPSAETAPESGKVQWLPHSPDLRVFFGRRDDGRGPNSTQPIGTTFSGGGSVRRRTTPWTRTSVLVLRQAP